MQLIETLGDLRAWRKSVSSTLSFVPTMGCLHEGHLSLVDEARKASEMVVASIFVNPKQFGPKEDFATYPRTFEADRSLLEARGVDVLFYPDASEFYPPGFQTLVANLSTAKHLCGLSRPGFFDGICTVLCKFAFLLRPDYIVLGEKDFQQVRVLEMLFADLGADLKVKRGKTCREANGLAMSSRNKYLSEEQREEAGKIFAAMVQTRSRSEQTRNAFILAESARNALREISEFQIDYCTIRREADLGYVSEISDKCRLFVAGVYHGVRLIDNLALTP